MKTVLIIAAGAMLASTATPADAGMRWGRFAFTGPRGGGFVASHSINRQVGGVQETRSFQGNGGAGITTTRNAGWGNGYYNGTVIHRANNGLTWGRTTTVSPNGYGGSNYRSTFVGPFGGRITASGTVNP